MQISNEKAESNSDHHLWKPDQVVSKQVQQRMEINEAKLT